MHDDGSQYLFDMRARGDWVRLRTLILLRWVAVIGQSGAVLIVQFAMGFQLPLGLCAALISAAVVANLFAALVYPPETRLSENATLTSLMFDLVQIVALLMVTGGLSNPFALLVLAPVTISASTLRLQPTLWLGIVAIVMVAITSSVYLPLVGPDGAALELPIAFRAGYAAALAVAVAFLSLYARRVTVESYAMSQALSATQVALAREQRLAAIGGIAAAAAHELGTPLATIKLVARELARELEDREELAEDARLIHAEAERCGRIMTELSRSGTQDAHVQHAPISAVIEEAAEPHMGRGVEIRVSLAGRELAEGGGAVDMPLVWRRPELIHGLRNLIQNGVDFARSTVWIDIAADETRLSLVIGDDGPGIDAEILPRLGEPYVSSRSHEQRHVGVGGPTGARDDGYEGMGLGVFIARTLLERTGAVLRFDNARGGGAGLPEGGAPAGATGAIIAVTWPKGAIRISKADSRRGLDGTPDPTAGSPPGPAASAAARV
ncbi:MAG: ActS/PrrB/RegB family redox-sensitive histidine kinase [Pseudomonadota bacterium]